MQSGTPKTGPDDLCHAARDCRRVWRWHWERFWLLRWENTLRRPSWRVDEEARAWRRMRAEVRRYAGLRHQIAARSNSRDTDTPAAMLGFRNR